MADAALWCFLAALAALAGLEAASAAGAGAAGAAADAAGAAFAGAEAGAWANDTAEATDRTAATISDWVEFIVVPIKRFREEPRHFGGEARRLPDL